MRRQTRAVLASAVLAAVLGGGAMAYAHDPDPAPAATAPVAGPATVNDNDHVAQDHAEEPPPGFVLQPPCPTGAGSVSGAGVLPSPPVTDTARVPSIERGVEQANRYLTETGASTLATADDATITEDGRLVIEVTDDAGNFVAHLEYVGIDVDWDDDDWAFESGTVCL